MRDCLQRIDFLIFFLSILWMTYKGHSSLKWNVILSPKSLKTYLKKRN